MARHLLLWSVLHFMMTLITGVPLTDRDGDGGGGAGDVTVTPTVVTSENQDEDYYNDDYDYADNTLEDGILLWKIL